MSMSYPRLGSVIAATTIALAGPALGQDMMDGHAMEMEMDAAETEPALADPQENAHGSHSADDLRVMSESAPKIHELHMAAGQHVVAHAATMYAGLVALGIDRDDNLEQLRQTRDVFTLVLTGLRHGDDVLGVGGFAHPAILEQLEKVERVWARYDAVVDACLAQSAVSSEDIDAIAAIDPELHLALTRMVAMVEYYSYQGHGFSILMPTVRQAGKLHVALQNIASKYVLTAQGNETSAAAMVQAAADFDRLLAALTHGDSDLRVISAPTPEIVVQFARIEVMWRQSWSQITTISGTGRATPATIARMQDRIADLGSEVDALLEMYHLL